MRISEARLRQLVREEVEIRIVKQTITEVVSEMNLNLSEEQRILLEKSVLDQIKSAAKKAALPIGVMAALAFGLQVAVDVQQLDGVGVTPAAAEQIQNALSQTQEQNLFRMQTNLLKQYLSLDRPQLLQVLLKVMKN